MDLAHRFSGFAAGALCLLVTQILFAQTPTTKRPVATVSGTVTIKGKPAPGITVGIRQAQVPNPNEIVARGLTDQDGRYRLTDVAAGTYEVTVAAPSYIIAEVTNSLRSKMILVSEGENVEGIDFALVRGGVITGRVTDAEARPVVQQQVFIYRADSWDTKAPNQSPQIFPMGGGMTDDRGIYRAFGLIPGRYKVAVGRGDDSFNPAQAPGRATYKRVFHPDTSDPARATVIDVTPGSEATGVDITLEKPVETYSISGRVVDGEKGQPAPGVRLGLERIGERFQTYSHFGTANASGEFIIDGVAPGKYTFSLIAERGNERALEAAPIDVTDGNVTGVVLRLTAGATISGVIVLENENPQAIAKLRQLELRGYVTPPSGTGGRSSIATL
ncbi:MAG TPA: carboxypeptidase-like regulatory domain-containing protein, partial [Pyrinomonadaceae bacterium]